MSLSYVIRCNHKDPCPREAGAAEREEESEGESEVRSQREGFWLPAGLPLETEPGAGRRVWEGGAAASMSPGTQAPLRSWKRQEN